MADDDTSPLLIRALAHEDGGRWRSLWESYNRFYEANVGEAVTAQTLARLLDPSSGVVGRVALDGGGQIVGFTNSVLHPSTWDSRLSWYLEDLFVDPAFRGRRIGQALIDDLVSLAKSRGCGRLYWHTREDNATARRLYDHYKPADGFVRYRLYL